jgi:prephenate dehydratase
VVSVDSTEVRLLDGARPDDRAVTERRPATGGKLGSAATRPVASPSPATVCWPSAGRWRVLATLERDVRVLVPPSLNGDELGRMLAALVPGLSRAVPVADRWFRGDRELILRLSIRSDGDPAHVRDAVIAQVEALVTPPAPIGTEVIAYLGPPGTFTEQAARALGADAVGDGAALVAVGGRALDRLSDHQADWAVIPVTNTLSGGVRPALEALAARSAELAVAGSHQVAVNFTAWVHPDDLAVAELQGVVSHEQALAQCGTYLATLGVPTRSVDSTAEACRVVADRDAPGWVALAGPTTGARYGLVPLAEQVADSTDSVTTFVLVRRMAPGVGRSDDRVVEVNLRDPSIRLPKLSPHEPPAPLVATS